MVLGRRAVVRPQRPGAAPTRLARRGRRSSVHAFWAKAAPPRATTARTGLAPEKQVEWGVSRPA